MHERSRAEISLPLAGSGKRVLLVAMPFASLNHPAIGLSLLQGSLQRLGFHADIRHLYIDFAEFIGIERYEAVNDDRYFLALVGEWLFAPSVQNGNGGEPDLAYITQVLFGEYRKVLDARRIVRILEARRMVNDFLEYCLNTFKWQDYDVIGFSSSFQQSMASLALAKRVKETYSDKLIVFGGANCEGEMGVELHRKFPFVDVVIGGEAELTFTELVRRRFARESLLGLPGTTVRETEGSTSPEQPSRPLKDLDELPELNYIDFLSDRSRAPNVAKSYDAVPLFESARGCWWGQKHHCTFCGLNALGMGYRSKSPTRAFDELVAIAERYGREILVVDNILDMKYFSSFLPRLAGTTPPLLMHYEVKANLTSSQLALLARAGVRKIQPGLESFSTNILKLMRKGTTMLRNVQTLKLAAEAGIYVEWGHLYGFPGETIDDYARIIELVPLLTHLSPPSAVTRVRADRFSPYFYEPKSFGISIDPLPAYKHIYPFTEESIRRLAYHFDITRPDDHAYADSYSQLERVLQAWSDRANFADLWIEHTAEGAGVVHDGRDTRRNRLIRLNSGEMRALAYAAEIKGIDQLKRTLSAEFGPSIAASAIAYLFEHALLLREGGEVLALPLRQPGFRRAPLKDEIRTSLHRSFFFQAQVADISEGLA